MDAPLPAVLIALAALVAAHLFGRHLTRAGAGPRSLWLSVGGGVAVAYVFVHLLPELAAGQRTVEEALGGVLGFVERHVYLIALFGLVAFYGLERAARGGGEDEGEDDARDDSPAAVFWLHVAVFALYNLIVGYLLLQRDEQGLDNLAFFTLAMALHFMVNDHALAEHHGDLYHRRGRWILSAAIVVGCGAAIWLPVSHAGAAVLLALVGGATILNVLKEELPAERRSRFWAFAAGAFGYAALLLLV